MDNLNKIIMLATEEYYESSQLLNKQSKIHALIHMYHAGLISYATYRKRLKEIQESE